MNKSVTKQIKTLAALTFGIMMLMSLSSCGSDDKEDVVKKADGFHYSVVLQVPSSDVDQLDIVRTVVTVKNSSTGAVLEETEAEFMGDVAIISPNQKICTLPFEGTVEVKQTLKDGVDLTKKEQYKTGLYIGVVISSLDKNNDAVAGEETHSSRSTTCYGDDLSKMYPLTTSFKFKVDGSGNVRLS